MNAQGLQVKHLANFVEAEGAIVQWKASTLPAYSSHCTSGTPVCGTSTISAVLTNDSLASQAAEGASGPLRQQGRQHFVDLQETMACQVPRRLHFGAPSVHTAGDQPQEGHGCKQITRAVSWQLLGNQQHPRLDALECCITWLGLWTFAAPDMNGIVWNSSSR